MTLGFSVQVKSYMASPGSFLIQRVMSGLSLCAMAFHCPVILCEDDGSLFRQASWEL